MKRNLYAKLAIAGLSLWPWTAGAQSERGHGTVPVARALEAASPEGGEAIREIADPGTGACWLLVRNRTHPGGPGRLVRVECARAAPAVAAQGGAAASDLRAPVIRGGDRVILEAHTAVMDAELEAVALAAAPAGARLALRLKIGGRVVTGVAEGPGRAEWAGESGVRP